MKLSPVHIIALLCLLMVTSTTAGAASAEVTTLSSRGNDAFKRGNFQEAEKLYSQALEKDALSPVLLYNKANALAKQKKYDEAATLYQEALAKGPSRKLLGSVYFNAGTVMLLQARGNDEETDIAKLRERLRRYEQSFDLFRKALEAERTLSISQGRSLEESGLYARTNWALAREEWTALWEKIRDLERKNMKLEDGISKLSHTYTTLENQLERIYLSALTDDTLELQLKRLAAYHSDYRDDSLALKELADKEVERIRIDLDNLKSNQSSGAKPNQPKQPSAAADDSALQKELERAQKIQAAVQQGVALDEWVADSLNRLKPLDAMQSLTSLAGLFDDLSAVLGGNDPVDSGYSALTRTLSALPLLIQEAALLQDTTETTSQQQTAISRRIELAGVKRQSAGTQLSSLNNYLGQMKEHLQKPERENLGQPAQHTTPDDNTTATEPTPAVPSAQEVLEKAFAQVNGLALDKLIEKNAHLNEELTSKDLALLQKNPGPAEGSSKELQELVTEAVNNQTFYQELKRSLPDSLAQVVRKLNTVADQWRTEKQTGINSPATVHKRSGPSNEQLELILFQLAELPALLDDMKEPDGDRENTFLKQLRDGIQRQQKSLDTTFKNYQALRQDESKATTETLPPAADLVRHETLTTLALFEPTMVIALSFERLTTLQKELLTLLPVSEENNGRIQELGALLTKEGEELQQLLQSAFTAMEATYADEKNKEKKEAYQAGINRQKIAVQQLDRFLKQYTTGLTNLKNQKPQSAELLFKEMENTLTKAQLAFKDQPAEVEQALQLALSLQKSLETQSRFADQVTGVEGAVTAINTSLQFSQGDIDTFCERGKESLQQRIGMAEVPTHGQAPNAPPPQAAQGQPDPSQLKKALQKIEEAQKQMGTVASFLKAGEFHNTFEKHPTIQALLQEALDLLQGKDEGKDKKDQKDTKSDKKNEKQQNDAGKNQPQKQAQNGGDASGQSHPKKPLEMSAGEARQLLEQLNQEDQKRQKGQKTGVGGHRAPNTPRPW